MIKNNLSIYLDPNFILVKQHDGKKMLSLNQSLPNLIQRLKLASQVKIIFLDIPRMIFIHVEGKY